MRAKLRALLAVGVLATSLTSCAAADDPNTITVAYHLYGNTRQVDALMQRVKQQYEDRFPGKTVELEPVVAPEAEYLSKLQLRMRSVSAAPDVIYEDSFHVNSDVRAGYLAPLEHHLARWPDWQHFIERTKRSGQAADGRTYAVPLDTDARGLWYNKELFARAGLPADWKPRTWSDVLDAARTVKREFPDAIGLDMPLGKAEGESVSMQTVQMLLHGTETGGLYDERQRKWIVPSEGFTDAMRFISTAVSEDLTQSKAQIADAQYDKKTRDDLTQAGKVAIRLDGSFASGDWQSAGWENWSETMAATTMPTQHGQAPGTVTISGGWTLALSKAGANKDAAFEFVKMVLSKENVVRYSAATGNLPARRDSAEDPRVFGANPVNPFWIGLLDDTRFRPALPEYPKVSEEIQAVVREVVDGRSPGAASELFTDEVRDIVEPTNTRGG